MSDERPQRRTNRRDVWVQWLSGLTLLTLIGAGIAFQMSMSQSRQPAREPRERPEDHAGGAQIRDMPFDKLLSLDPRRAPDPGGKAVNNPSNPAGQPGDGQPGGGQPGDGQPRSKHGNEVPGGDGQAVSGGPRVNPSPAPTASGEEKIDIQGAAAEKPGSRPLSGDEGTGSVPNAGDIRPPVPLGPADGGVNPPRPPQGALKDENDEGHNWVEVLPRAPDPGPPPAPSDEVICAPELTEVFGSAVMVVANSTIEREDLKVEAFIHLVYTLQQTEGLALQPREGVALRSALDALRLSLNALAGVELEITRLLTEQQKESLSGIVAESQLPSITMDTLDAQLKSLVALLEEKGVPKPGDMAKVADDSYPLRPWRFGFPIMALAVGIPDLVEKGQFDAITMGRIYTLAAQAVESTQNARDAVLAIDDALQEKGLSVDRVLRTPAEKRVRFEPEKGWEPVFLGMINATLRTLE